MMALACSRGEQPLQVTVDVTSRNQTIEGWGTSMIFWSLSLTPYQDPAWRLAYRDLGLNILRVNINKEVLVDASGDLAVPVRLGPNPEENIAKMNFANSKTAVYGEMAVWLRQKLRMLIFDVSLSTNRLTVLSGAMATNGSDRM